jgi:hypothetical protein
MEQIALLLMVWAVGGAYFSMFQVNSHKSDFSISNFNIYHAHYRILSLCYS